MIVKLIKKAKKRLPKNKSFSKLIAFIAIFLVFGLSIHPVLASDKTISTPTAFASLDGSAQDDDGTTNGIFTVNGSLALNGNGSITCNDPASPPNDSACPIRISVSQDLTMDAGTSITAENNVSGGSGGSIEISVGGNILLKGPSGSDPGAKISSARTTTGGSGNGGDLSITAGGSIDFESGTIVSAADLGGGKAGDINISSQSPMNLDGLISAGPSNTVLSTKLTEFVLERGNTTQRGGKISITCTSGQVPGVTVSTDGVIVSQGEDPASDTITISGCGINVYGLVASVAKKSNGSPGNSPQVILKSGEGVLVNGSNLGSAGPNQGKIRADYIVGENQIPNKIDIFAKNDILILGPTGGTIYTLSSNGGSATNQRGGTITLISTDGKADLTGLSIQADGIPGSGSMGGTVDIKSKLDVDLSDASIIARGSTSGGNPDGGHVFVRSYSQNILSSSSSLIDVTGGSPNPEGTVDLTACGTIGFPPGNITPVSPTKITGICSPGAPSLPQGVTLPECSQPTPTPTETVTPTPTLTLTPTPTVSVTPTPTEVTPTPTESVTPTPTVSITPTPSEEVTPSPTPTVTLTLTPTPINECPEGQVFDSGLHICVDCPGGGTCEVIIGSPTPTLTPTETPQATPTPTNTPSVESTSTTTVISSPTKSVLGTTTLAQTGDFTDRLTDILLFSGLLTMGIGFVYGQKKTKKTR